MTENANPADNAEMKHESSQVPSKPIVLVLTAIVAGVVASLLLVAWFLDVLGPPAKPSPQRPASADDLAVQLRALRAQEEAILTSYGEVEPKDQGIVRIPIERAKELILQEGLPIRSAPDAGSDAMPDETIPPAEKLR